MNAHSMESSQKWAGIRTDLTNSEWTEALKALAPSSRDVYFTPGYHQLHQVNGDGEVFSSMVRYGEEMLMLTGIRSEIARESASGMWDLQTCNGYGGPIASPGASSEFVKSAWAEWKEACREAGMVAAFFRLHPLLHNLSLLPADAEVRLERQTVFVDLSDGSGPAWHAAQTLHRRKVNRSIREGVMVRWNETVDWDAFELLYSQAMRRLNAPERLSFSEKYFEELRSLPGAELAAIRSGNSLTAAMVFLYGEVWGHYHLGARSEDAANHAMSRIMQAAFERAVEKGLKGVHLGGGRSASKEDSLLAFKASTGGCHLDFHVALVVTNRPAFEQLCNRWHEQAGFSPSWLLGYRQPH